MTDDEAERLAAELNARHHQTGPRPDTDWHHLDPPVPIDIKFLTWQPAELDYWVREPDGWYGHVLQPGSEPRRPPRRPATAASSRRPDLTAHRRM
jgi:hypothetical protein